MDEVNINSLEDCIYWTLQASEVPASSRGAMKTEANRRNVVAGGPMSKRHSWYQGGRCVQG